MKKLHFLLFLIAVVVIAACAAGITVVLGAKWQHQYADAHDWVHTKLSLTREQETSLEPIERHYQERRQILERELQRANADLAEAILATRQQSPAVDQSIKRIHAHMGDLQKLTISHVFEMREVLSDEQYQTLLNLTADALRSLDQSSGDASHH